MQSKINQFVKDLYKERNFKPQGIYQNPWKDNTKKINLINFLNSHKDAKYILIGEAPGRKGCLQCGVPFCDESTLGKLINISVDKNIESHEVTAQRIYKTFGKVDFVMKAERKTDSINMRRIYKVFISQIF